MSGRPYEIVVGDVRRVLREMKKTGETDPHAVAKRLNRPEAPAPQE